MSSQLTKEDFEAEVQQSAESQGLTLLEIRDRQDGKQPYEVRVRDQPGREVKRIIGGMESNGTRIHLF